ncbi:MAG: hemolysin family protein [Chloroflexi bacterium]|nr:hemolysin family protein [Chloroflexota bacterium]
MDSDSLYSAIALAVSLILFLVLSIGEAALASVRRDRVLRLLAERAHGAATLERLYGLPMGPAGVFTLLSATALSASLISGAALIISELGTRWAFVGLVSLGVLLAAALLRILARSLAHLKGERIALTIALAARALAWLFNPLLTLEAGLLRRLAGESRPPQTTPETYSAEIDLPIESAGEPLDEYEVRMIRAVVQLDRTVAREIMVPRVDMVAADMDTSIATLAEMMVESGHSRVPIYKEHLDRIEGIAYARDVLRLLSHSEAATPDTNLEGVIRPSLFIPESKPLKELLEEFRQRRVHMAIVVDEYGGVSGLVTIEDLLEEIVGEIQDEFDEGEPEIEHVGENEFIFDARISLDALNEMLNVSVAGDGFDTLGGFVFHALGKIPSPGDTVSHDGLKLEVISTTGRRLKRVRVTKVARASAESYGAK